MPTIEFVPYTEIEELNSAQRVKKLIKVCKEDKIIFLEGRLTPEEEAKLISKTMEEVSPSFKGIELYVHNPGSEGTMSVLKKSVLNWLVGNRFGLTIIGPSSVVKEIKQDPGKIQLLTKEVRKKKANSSKKKRRR
jgi:uncharacterized protein